MAFIVHSTDDHRVPVLEYLPIASINTHVGMAMVAQGGTLVLASGTKKPTYICQTKGAAYGSDIPVIRVQPDMIFEVTVSGDGLQVTATTEGGVAEVVAMDGTEAGATCRVRFV